MFISSLTDRGATPALVHLLAFTDARQRVIAENVANFGTPGYKTKQLDARAFQGALKQALDERGDDPRQPFRVANSDEFGTRPDGTLRVTPTLRPENVLFHDGTDASIERQMADLAETAMTHEAATTLLNGRFEGLRKAIRGRA